MLGFRSSKKSYSDLEVQEILGSLFAEKKKVAELELKLKNNYITPPAATSPAEIDALRTEIQTLRLRYQEALSQSTSEEHHQRVEQLEKAIQFMKKRLEEAHLENQELLKKLESTEHSKTEIPSSSIELMRLADALQAERLQNEELLKRLENPTQSIELKRLDEALKAERLQKNELIKQHAVELKSLSTAIQEEHQRNEELLKQLESSTHLIELKNLSETLQAERFEREELQAEEKALREQLEVLREHALKLQKEAKQGQENKEALLNSQREIELLKQMMMRTVQEFKEERFKEEQQFKTQIEALKTELQNEQTAQVELKRLSTEQAANLITLDSERQKLQKDLHEALQHNESLSLAHRELGLFTEELKQKLLKAEENRRVTQELLSQNEFQSEKLEAQVFSLQRSLSEKEELLRQTKEEAHEHESRLRIAQHHLAKKVREASGLAEKNQELTSRIVELEHALESSRAKLLEIQFSLDADGSQKKKLQEQYQNSLKTIENQAAKWEEKYFQIHEKWQEGEARLRELKRLEERYHKLQSTLGQLGHLLGSPLLLPEVETETQTEAPAKAPVEEKKIVSVVNPVQPTLFESAGASRYKESLFG